MKRLAAFLFCLPLWLGSVAARAADWVPVTVSHPGHDYYYDRSKLNIKDDEVSYWQKVVFSAPQSLRSGEASYALQWNRIDCAQHSVRHLQELHFSAAGQMLENASREDAPATPIIPDGVDDAFEQILCMQVWQKQEEARLKAEQKAADGQSASADKEQAPPPASAPSRAAEAAGQQLQKPPAAPLPQSSEQLY